MYKKEMISSCKPKVEHVRFGEKNTASPVKTNHWFTKSPP